MKYINNIQRFLTGGYIRLLCCIGCMTTVVFSYSQTIAYYKGSDCVFNSLSDVNAGCTSSNYLTVQYGGFSYGDNYSSGWTLRVRANGNFSNGSTTIAAQYVSIRYASSNGGPSSISSAGYKALSTGSYASLFTSYSSIQTPPHYYFEHRFDLRVTGGSHLTVGTGTYTGTVTLTLVDRYGNTIASNNNVQLSFVVNYNNSCNSATIGSYSGAYYTFTNVIQELYGATITDAATIQYNPNSATCAGWSLKVRAAGSFTNGSNTISPQYFSLRFNRVSAGQPSAADIGVTNNSVALSTTDVTLINQADEGFTAYTATEHKFDMIIQGGFHLIFLPNGVYSGNLIFTLYNQNNQVVSTTTVTVSFAINSSSSSYTAVFQNSADNINLTFNTVNDYINGVSVAKTNGLKITAYSPYQVMIKTSSANLVSASGSLPVSVVSLEATKNSSTSDGIETYTRELSNAEQLLITNPLVDYTQSVVEYNLRYFTQPGDKRLSAPAGTFNTSVVFVIIPK